jgi:DNA helicase-2/ATP-dependent DNA helicase PcrA
LIATLSHEQMEAAHAGPDGAFLIAAGPGTGKTLTMVERFLWLVRARHVEPASIMAVTFTDAAAGELRERIESELETQLDEAWIGTFHGLCARLLRENAYLIGMAREVSVLDEIGQLMLKERLQAALRSGAEGSIDIDALTALSSDEVEDLLKRGLKFALWLKGKGIDPDGFFNRATELHALQEPSNAPAAQAETEAIGILHMIYAAYERWLDAAGQMDFDDLILETIRALESVPAFRERCHQAFRYILVDEFQDTNRIQLELIRLLAADGFGNVAVVGDAKQSIYGWRDADIENIRSRFGGRRLPLTHNRRSYQEILDLATSFIRRDPDFADEPDLVAQRGRIDRPVTVLMATDSQREADMVAGEIRKLVRSGRQYSEIAILSYSVKRLPREFEDALRAHGIPYVTSGGTGFFDREEVKDVLAMLRLTHDPMDDAALVRVLQGPIVRLDDAGMYMVASRRFDGDGMRLRDCLDQVLRDPPDWLDPAVAERVQRMLAVTDRLAVSRDAVTVADILNRLLDETGYQRHCQLRAAIEGPRAVLNLRKVMRMASRFERDSSLAGIGDFVRHLDRIMASEVTVGEAQGEQGSLPEAVSLLTIHAAKGLEFPVVFLVNLRPPRPIDTERFFFDPEEGGFVMKYFRGEKHPRFVASSPSAASIKLALRERRRAVYVALTRAADRLYVSATRIESTPADVEVREDDHFAEILSWATANPEAARVVTAEEPELLPQPETAAGADVDGRQAVVTIISRLELLAPAAVIAAPEPPPVALSFSDLQDFEVCPVRYRFRHAWEVPAPPDELLPPSARVGRGAAELGAEVHAALAAWHSGGGDLLELYSGPAAGADMLRAYLAHPLASAPTLGTEVEFNLRLGEIRVRGLVDRICRLDDRIVLVDYKTNATLDERLKAAYSTQLRLYGLAAAEGVIPGGPDPRLILFDLRRGDAIEVSRDPDGVRARVESAAAAIAAGRFELGPEHARRPCFICAYRPICPDARV